MITFETLKELYRQGMPIKDELAAFMNESQTNRSHIHYSADPWWGFAGRVVTKYIREREEAFLLNNFDVSHPYIDMFDDALDVIFRSSVLDFSKNSRELLDLIDNYDCPHLMARNSRIATFKNREFNYQECMKTGMFDKGFCHLSLAYFSYFEEKHWIDFYRQYASHIKIHKKSIGASNNVVENSTSLLKYLPIFEKDLITDAWLDDSLVLRVFYYTLIHKKLPASTSDATNFLKSTLYEKFGVNYNSKSRIQMLFNADDNVEAVRHYLNGLIKNDIPTIEEIALL